jgi:small neutral amino acid transporter SnatA (MarC family)
MLNEFLTALGISVGAMFPIINPVGHAPMFYAMTQDDTPAFRRRTVWHWSRRG